MAAPDGSSTSCSGSRTGAEETVPADGLFLMIGARPHTEWLPPEIASDERGFVVTGPDLGDEAVAPGSSAAPARDERAGGVRGRRRAERLGEAVASAVGEGSVAIQMLHQLFEAEQLRPRGRSGGAAGAGEAASAPAPG